GSVLASDRRHCLPGDNVRSHALVRWPVPVTLQERGPAAPCCLPCGIGQLPARTASKGNPQPRRRGFGRGALFEFFSLLLSGVGPRDRPLPPIAWTFTYSPRISARCSGSSS